MLKILRQLFDITFNWKLRHFTGQTITCSCLFLSFSIHLNFRVKELENELDSEQRRMGDATKNFRKSDRGCKEYTFRQEEDRKNAERMQDLVDKLQNQVRSRCMVNGTHTCTRVGI